ncbi:MAG: hypothetical protein MUC96_09445 [Myxococcaceae bacterium]|jgi:hypothetical protein|nr:hypothetical protein [Myxococcaceae bacterium]
MSSLRRQHRAWLALTAVGLLALQAWVTVHLGVEAHTVGSDGALIELHAPTGAHAHDERSLCDGAALDGSWFDGGPCEALVDFAVTEASALPQPGKALTLTLPSRRTDPPRSAIGLWQLAPKGSPPRA